MKATDTLKGLLEGSVLKNCVEPILEREDIREDFLRDHGYTDMSEEVREAYAMAMYFYDLTCMLPPAVGHTALVLSMLESAGHDPDASNQRLRTIINTMLDKLVPAMSPEIAEEAPEADKPKAAANG